MNPIEIIISALAPHVCASCGQEGDPVCGTCLHADATRPPLACYRCSRPTALSYVCINCSAAHSLSFLLPSATYAGLAKDLTKQLKFQRVKAAAVTMAHFMDSTLPLLPQSAIICPVPTAPRRVRSRGYDQAVLIAQSFAKRRKLPYKELLSRTTSTRQVGASRYERFLQIEGAFTVRHKSKITGSNIILVDDVLTTGSTLESAARTLYAHGAKEVGAITFAYQAKGVAFPSSTRIDSG